MPQFTDLKGKVRSFDYTYEGQQKYEKEFMENQKAIQGMNNKVQVSQNIQNQGSKLTKDMTQTFEAPGNMNPSEIKAWQYILYDLNIIKNLDEFEPGVWNSVTQDATMRHRQYMDEGLSDTNIYRRELGGKAAGLPDVEDKIEDVLMDKMGDAGAMDEREVQRRAALLNREDPDAGDQNETMGLRRMSGMDSY